MKGIKALYNFEIDDIFAKSPGYLGTFSKDQTKGVKIPRNKDSFAIINLENEDDGNGSHWVSMYNRTSDKQYIYYFDSFGVIPSTETIKWLKTTGKLVLYNTSHIQNIKSSSCGWYAIAFIEHCRKGGKYLDFTLLFDNDGDIKGRNEKVLKDLIKSHRK